MASDNEDISSEPDFSEFADWHVEKQDESWPYFGEFEMDMTAEQERIIASNVSLLENRVDWNAKTTRFSRLIESISNDEERAKILKQFQIRFDKYEFNKADFNGYSFPCVASFSGAVFKDTTVNFHRAVFKESVSFNGAKFINTPACFFGMTIQKGDFYFTYVHVENRVINFFKAQFLGDIAEFDFMVLKKAGFSANEVKVTGHLFIKNTRFPCVANFRRLSVGGACDLSKNTFNKVPDFTSSIFDRPPDVSGVDVLAFKGVNILELWSWPCWKSDKDEGTKFRKLKAMALAANDHEKDGEFFAYEMLAKRGHDAANKGRFALFINWVYFILSNYGQSYRRPLFFSGISYCGFTFCYALKARTLLEVAESFDFALGYSFRNVFPFLGSLFGAVFHPKEHKSRFEEIFEKLAPQRELVDWLVTVGFVQNAIGAVLLFLLLLGLRNKFRLK